VLVICCDGLTGMVRDEDIARIVRAHEDLNDGCRELVAAANERGGVDNITVVLVRTT
jgi:serine/threonine protein phosphatase PrpC